MPYRSLQEVFNTKDLFNPQEHSQATRNKGGIRASLLTVLRVTRYAVVFGL